MTATPKEKMVDALYDVLTKLDKVDVERAVDAHFSPLIDSRDKRIAHLSRVVAESRKNLIAPLGQGDIECTQCFGIGFIKDTSVCPCVTMKCS